MEPTEKDQKKGGGGAQMMEKDKKDTKEGMGYIMEEIREKGKRVTNGAKRDKKK